MFSNMFSSICSGHITAVVKTKQTDQLLGALIPWITSKKD